MAKNLNSLIRLHDWEVDEKRRELAERQSQADILALRARQLEENLIAEQKVAAESPDEGGLLYGNFAHLTILRREQLAKAIAEAEQQVAEAREMLGDAYRELKKYEVVQAGRESRARAETARREQIVLDEIGLQGHVRRTRATLPRKG